MTIARILLHLKRSARIDSFALVKKTYCARIYRPLLCVYEATDSAFCTRVDWTLPHCGALSVARSRDRGSNPRINETQVSSSSQSLSQLDFEASAEVKDARVTAPGENPDVAEWAEFGQAGASPPTG
jgi:hypothetical protein